MSRAPAHRPVGTFPPVARAQVANAIPGNYPSEVRDLPSEWRSPVSGCGTIWLTRARSSRSGADACRLRVVGRDEPGACGHALPRDLDLPPARLDERVR